MLSRFMRAIAHRATRRRHPVVMGGIRRFRFAVSAAPIIKTKAGRCGLMRGFAKARRRCADYKRRDGIVLWISLELTEISSALVSY